MGLKRSLIFLTLLGGTAFADNLPLCGPGDGPSPLPFKTHGIQDTIVTAGPAQEFVVWEGRQKIVYRNDKGELYITGLSGGNGGKKFASSSKPLTHFADPQEEYLTTSIGAWFLDTQGGHWIQYNTVVPEIEPIFWDGDDMYAVANSTDLTGSVLKIYKYHANDKYVMTQCDKLHYNVANGYHLAQGHSFPYVYLYQQIPLSQGTVVNLVRVDATNCAVDELPAFKLVTQGRIENVYRFEKQDAIAIKLDTPTKNLLWKQGNLGCAYFDIGPDAQPILLNRDLPVMATYSAYSAGVQLYDFRDITKRQVHTTSVLDDGATPILNLGAQDLYLSENGRQLFVRPGVTREGSSSLLRVRFNGFLSDNP